MNGFFDSLTRLMIGDEIDMEDLLSAKSRIAEDNRRLVRNWSLYFSFFWLFCLVLSLGVEQYRECRGVYQVVLAGCLLSLLCACLVSQHSQSILRFNMYLLDTSILVAGVGIALFQPNERTALMMVAAVVVPVLLIDYSYVPMILDIAAVIAFIILGKEYIDPNIFAWSFTELAVYTGVGITIGRSINRSRLERYVYGELEKKLADMQTKYAYYDQMTGLLNRRAFAEDVARLSAELAQDKCVISLDLNGLKTANDTYGHEAGDELINKTADCLRAAFEDVDMIYRIGGDEFAVIIDGTAADAAPYLSKLDRVCEQTKSRYFDRVSLAYGAAGADETGNIDPAVNLADERMYENKRAYYMTSGHDRRKN